MPLFDFSVSENVLLQILNMSMHGSFHYFFLAILVQHICYYQKKKKRQTNLTDFYMMIVQSGGCLSF